MQFFLPTKFQVFCMWGTVALEYFYRATHLQLLLSLIIDSVQCQSFFFLQVISSSLWPKSLLLYRWCMKRSLSHATVYQPCRLLDGKVSNSENCTVAFGQEFEVCNLDTQCTVMYNQTWLSQTLLDQMYKFSRYQRIQDTCTTVIR